MVMLEEMYLSIKSILKKLTKDAIYHDKQMSSWPVKTIKQSNTISAIMLIMLIMN